MKTLLYITASPSKEDDSISKKLGRYFVTNFLKRHPEYQLEELNLYQSHIPEVWPIYLGDELKLVSGEAYDKLSSEDKKAVDRIDELGDQFIKADMYVIATPMWDLTFPARLKMYIDCICLGGKVINFKDEKKRSEPLLNDKERNMFYLQTAGGDFPFFLEWKLNHGVNYCKDLFKGLGIAKFEKILVEGVIQYEEEPEKYLDEVFLRIDELIKKY
ncbi:FMN-dependent NADH-azoreductase [Cellulosilyticum ruminicola]|uniref:FMN-dependent NADH-azoreductase n=1 Tax=Cellulosilyticum ruminicola TaxID=425254 RepID=UPI0006D0BE39|nr:NAD(P)H-dependent oxidoreductase [Cellulosilyticum ruminicola]